MWEYREVWGLTGMHRGGGLHGAWGEGEMGLYRRCGDRWGVWCEWGNAEWCGAGHQSWVRWSTWGGLGCSPCCTHIPVRPLSPWQPEPRGSAGCRFTHPGVFCSSKSCPWLSPPPPPPPRGQPALVPPLSQQGPNRDGGDTPKIPAPPNRDTGPDSVQNIYLYFKKVGRGVGAGASPHAPIPGQDPARGRVAGSKAGGSGHREGGCAAEGTAQTSCAGLS